MRRACTSSTAVARLAPIPRQQRAGRSPALGAAPARTSADCGHKGRQAPSPRSSARARVIIAKAWLARSTSHGPERPVSALEFGAALGTVRAYIERMTKEEMRARLDGELAQAHRSVEFWARQVPMLPQGPLQAAASRTLNSALVTARELTAAIEEMERG